MSGTVLHTGLGRARLAPEAAMAAARAASGHACLEFDLESGGRGDRQDAVRPLLRALTGAEDALVVNNCASAVVLALASLGAGAGVVLSRGEMVEIGGAFRMPEIVEQAGCRLVEVGCTNKTRVADYAAAWDPDVRAALRCHRSNFSVSGFTDAPTDRQLAEFAHGKGGWFVHDLGSGCLVDTALLGLAHETTVQEAVAAGADIVALSGDKLLGGPQAGILVGTSTAVRTMARHPLARAFRADKLALAALAATLRLYVEGRWQQVPVWRYASRPAAEVRRLAARLAKACALPASVRPCSTELGGGSLPGQALPSFACVIEAERPDRLAERLRSWPVPVVGYVRDGRLWLDPRTAEAEEVRDAARGLASL
jgi:L-seryl-tRNA(Ser) seleniumtransferase